ncbi:MAG TPA: hypothetical protein VJ672_11475, partial [Gemmatimonadaceae bacterium]|nr:hypothetical protein [Gemmatimonadaceae bacterium]
MIRPEHIEPDGRITRVVAPVLAALLAIVAFLPIVDWIPGGRTAPWYQSVLDGWLSGTAIAVGAGLVLAILSRRMPILWRDGLGTTLGDAFDRAPARVSLGIAAVAAVLYAWIAHLVFDARPLLIDEMAQMLQARIFASGSISRPVSPRPEFFSMIHVVDMHGRVYSQFPAGGPFFLALGVLIRAPWIIGPIFGAAAILAYGHFLKFAEERPTTSLMALVLFALAPFTAFMAASHMNHVPTLAFLLVAMAALARVMTERRPAWWWSLACGLGFGIAATIRPIDAIAFALPAGAWYLWRAIKEPARWRDALVAAAGIAIPVALLAWVNLRTTGAPLRFGYVVLWGPSHSLGFHDAPWGVTHTPARGLELVSLYFLRLQSYLFETPIPSLLPAIGALALTRKFNALDRYLVVCSALLVGLYFAYWHDGFFLGPRFLHPLLPVLALWTARLFPLVRERLGRGLAERAVMFAFVVSLVIAAVALVPLRAHQYRGGLLTMRWDAERAAREAGVSDAIVFVRESWGAQLVARMWAIGIPRSETEKLYRGIDACVLEQQVSALESSRVRDTAAFLALRPLLRDSSRVRPSPFSPDTTERFLPGTP